MTPRHAHVFCLRYPSQNMHLHGVLTFEKRWMARMEQLLVPGQAHDPGAAAEDARCIKAASTTTNTNAAVERSMPVSLSANEPFDDEPVGGYVQVEVCVLHDAGASDWGREAIGQRRARWLGACCV